MAIGVSFTGYDGKKIESVAQDTNDLLRIMGERDGARLGETHTFGRRNPVNPVESIKQLSMNINNISKTIKEPKKFDPIDGSVCGMANTESTKPDHDSRAIGTKGGFRIVVSRTEEKYEACQEMRCDKVTLVKLEFDLIFSQDGLCKGRSPERKVWEKSFYVMKANEEEGSGSGNFCVRAFWGGEGTSDKPTLQMLAFGTDANLNTYDGSKFTCNYDEDGELRKDAPVKRVAVSACTNGMKG